MRVPRDLIDGRREELRGLVNSSGFMPVTEICRRLRVSEATARRDLVAVERSGHITRTYGGALAGHKSASGPQGRRPGRARSAHRSAEQDRTDAMLALAGHLGREDRRLAILGEGNVSARLSDTTFIVKASGSNLASLDCTGISKCRFGNLIAMLDAGNVGDQEIHEALLAARVSAASKKPSVEAIFHAYLLSLPGVNFVGHTHPISVNQVLCSRHSRMFARRRIFPDEIVCCGIESVFVPYTDPGLKLAQAIRKAVVAYIRRLSRPPRIILLENHGSIAIGATVESVTAATLMCAKAAEIFVGAVAIGGAPRFLAPAQAIRIAERPDEHYRQEVLGL
jgi:rhamnose utilization protein RhaD (predicted bifunctional aldolase and dehydrogenase)